ncbi:hypothetical protein C3L33_17252, partial [Rhododendron williamsianum]
MFISKLLNRNWTSLKPDTKIHKIVISVTQIQYDGKPLENVWFSNDAASPALGDSLMEKEQPTAIVLYSVSCAERGLRSHLLLRGEQPEIPTAYNLISSLYGNVIYVPRSLYAKREEMLSQYADSVAGSSGSVVHLSDILEDSLSTHLYEKPNFKRLDAHRSADNSKRVVIVNEGAGDAVGFLWEGSGVWKFGKLLAGEVKECQRIAQQTGILVDPVYTLAGWELATQLSRTEVNAGAKVVMLHTGGTLGMFGLAQRYKSDFYTLK